MICKNMCLAAVTSDSQNSGLLSKGSLFHSTVHSYLSGATVALEPDIEGCWQSMSGVLPNITNISVLESHVVHSQLLYRGIIDCVAEYKHHKGAVHNRQNPAGHYYEQEAPPQFAYCKPVH
uniref:Uncharacterized protein n=1 Tax=Timema shepardi TaxID=629360 RepID=A0A7R9AR39_TIMSH|nr:unnamed protein product [Timema shepardi]